MKNLNLNTITLVLLGLFLVSTTVLQAQTGIKNSKSAAEVKLMMWGPDDKVKDMMEIPKKWEGESAVILYRERKSRIKNNSRSAPITQWKTSRKRIKILDQAAVEDYSTLTFADKHVRQRGLMIKYDKRYTHFGIKIIKPDGSEKEVDMSKAVATEKEKAGIAEKKIAIPGLEKGDIIDYYYYEHKMFRGKGPGYHPFPMEEYFFAEEYPIVKQKFELLYSDAFLFNYQPTNGAPEITPVSPVILDKVTYKVISIEDQMREKSDPEFWVYPRRTLPVLKYALTLCYNGCSNTRRKPFLGEDWEPKKGSNKEALLKWIKPQMSFSPDRIKSLKKKDKVASDLEYATYIYYNLRYYYYYYIQSSEYFSYATNSEKEALKRAVHHFRRRGLKQNGGLKVDLILVPPRRITSLENILFYDEIELGLRIKVEGKYCFAFFDTPYRLFNKIPPQYEGAEAYIIPLKWKTKEWEIEKFTLPTSSHNENNSTSISEVSISEDFSTLAINRTTNLTGMNKSYYQRRILVITDYIGDDDRKYDLKTKYYYEKIEDKERQEQKEIIEKVLKDEFEDLECEFLDLKIKEPGRSDEKPTMVFVEKYKLSNLLKKAGPNYLLEVGKLIGSQVETGKEDENRKEDIYMSSPRSYNENISIQIPEGYTVKGLDKLNKSVMNATGGFKSEAKIEGGKLIISTYKFYLHNFEPAKNFGQMLSFLRAAEDFTQQKLLLVKE